MKIDTATVEVLFPVQLTWTDIYFAHYLSLIFYVNEGKNGAKEKDKVLEAYPKVKGHLHKVVRIPAIAEWIAKRPATEH